MVSASMSSRIEAFAQLLTLFIIFILVLAITYYVTRFVGNYQKNKMSGSNINILETMRISNTKYIQVVKIGSKVFAIAVAKDTVTYLCELNEDELVYNESSSGKMLMNSESFKDILETVKNSASILILTLEEIQERQARKLGGYIICYILLRNIKRRLPEYVSH